MALITRISRLFKADFHAVIDQMEEPDIVLRQAVREMEEAVTKRDQTISQMTHEREIMAQQLAELANNLQQTEEELNICFESGEEDLIKTLIKRKLQTGKRQQQLTRHREQLDKRLQETTTRQAECQSILESMQQKAAYLDAETVEPGYAGHPGNDALVTEADVEIAYLKEKQKRALS